MIKTKTEASDPAANQRLHRKQNVYKTVNKQPDKTVDTKIGFGCSEVYFHKVMPSPFSSVHGLYRPLVKELESCDQEELLQKDLGVQDGDVGCSANQGVGGVRQRVDDIIAHQVAVSVLKHWYQQVLYHLSIDRA